MPKTMVEVVCDRCGKTALRTPSQADYFKKHYCSIKCRGGEPSVLFWGRVNKGNNPDECWEWSGSTKNGYGIFRAKRKGWLAHRYSYFLAHHQHPGNLYVCHKCDNKKCVNPDHLFLGTQTDNLQDASRKGLMPHGSKNAQTRFTEDVVRQMRSDYKDGISLAEIGRKYQAGASVIFKIVKGLTWKHLK